MTRAFVGLGSNLGDREATILRALARLQEEPELGVVRVSSLRETEPVGYVDQPRFLNGVVELETELPARDLLSRLLAIERELGRTRGDGRRSDRARSTSTSCFTERTRLSRPGSRFRILGTAAFALELALAVAAWLQTCSRRTGRVPRHPGPRRGSDSARGARIGHMSHLDELDEFEAELELALKKEYTAVFSLFRYCVLTQDATYLCNKLDLQYLPQPSYPFFHLKMEDVWVWDKNRPTRIIPRAEVYTSSDVTVEELRGEGDEPSLTAEALAERIGESLSTDED